MTTPSFTALIQEFTKNENILVIYKNADISKFFLLSFIGRELVSLNIENLGKFFSIKKKELMEEKKWAVKEKKKT